MMRRGSCLCGQVAYAVEGEISAPSACHCTQCRKQSGHVWASSFVKQGQFRLTEERGLRWYRASPLAERGFCGNCGAFLFWRHLEEDTISFSMGSLDGPTGVTLGKHIFTADKGDYYQISDGVPQS